MLPFLVQLQRQAVVQERVVRIVDQHGLDFFAAAHARSWRIKLASEFAYYATTGCMPRACS